MTPFTNDDRKRAAAERQLALDCQALADKFGVATRNRVLDRLNQMPASMRHGYVRALLGGRAAAIQAFCLECSGWRRKRVYTCEDDGCPLYESRPRGRKAKGG